MTRRLLALLLLAAPAIRGADECASAAINCGCPPGHVCDCPETAVSMDDDGVSWNSGEQISRVISLAPAVTEILFASGLHDRLLADTQFCDHPAAAKRLPKIGGILDPDYEHILALKPQRVIGMGMMPSSVKKRLRRLKLPLVYFKEPARLDEFGGFFLNVANAAGDMAAGIKLKQTFECRLRHLDRRGSATRNDEPACLVLGSGQPLWTAGCATFLDDLLQTAGCRNAAAEYRDWTAIEVERVAGLKPDWIFFIGKPAPAGSPLDRLIRSRGIRTLVLDEDMASRPGPRILEVLRQVETALGTPPVTRPAPSIPELQAPSPGPPHAP